MEPRRADRFRASLRHLGVVAREPDLRRIEIASAVSTASRWAYVVVLLVLAYEAAGPLGIAILGVVRTVPTVIAVPLAGAAWEHVPRRRLLVATYLGRVVAMVVIAAGVLVDQPALILGAAGIDAVLGTFRRPVQAALLPLIARAPADLVATNVATTTGEGLAGIVGPVVGSTLFVANGAAAVLVSSAIGFLLAALLVARVSTAGAVSRPELHSTRGSLARGVDALAREPIPRVVTIGFLVQVLARGAMAVLLVPAATLVYGMGQAGIGPLYAAMGVGGLIGAAGSFVAIGPERLTTSYVGGLATWGLPLVVLGFVSGPGAALAMLFAIGVGNAVLDVAGYSLLQRTLPNAVRASALTTFEGIAEASIGLGGLLAAPLIAAAGIQSSFVACGMALVLCTLYVAPRLGRQRGALEARTADVATLRRVPLLSPLSLAIVEELAGLAERRRFSPGAAVITEGEASDSYYVIVEGTADVTIGGRHVRTLGPGDGFGEIALLHGVPRTATVRAASDLATMAIDGPAFVAAVTGDPVSLATATETIDERLSSDSAS